MKGLLFLLRRLNRMLHADMAIDEELCCIVVDELHYLGDGERGALLELFLTKVKYLSREQKQEKTIQKESGKTPSYPSPLSLRAHRLQLIGLTATCPNIEDIGQWLHAYCYVSDYRPIPLQEYLKMGNTLYAKDADGQLVPSRSLPNSVFNDSDHIGYLVKETVQGGHSALVFCATKFSSINEAKRLAKYIEQCVGEVDAQDDEIEGRRKLANAIKALDLDHSSALSQVIFQGVSWHNADLTKDERILIEAGFQERVLKVLCSTPTLATGVNLPVHRVIFKHAYVSSRQNPLNSSKYRQMSGRAGRAGIDEHGESFLIASKDAGVTDEYLKKLIVSDIQKVHSALKESIKGVSVQI